MTDNYTTLQAFSIVLSIAIQLAVTWGYGMHKADLAKDELEMCLKWFFIAQTPYKVVVCLNKVSVILLYLRIFVSKYFRIAAFVCSARSSPPTTSGTGSQREPTL